MSARDFPDRLYLSAAVATAFGGFAMTAAIISGDAGEVSRLLTAYICVFRAAVVAVIGAAVYALFKGDDG